ncbi:TIGR04282 family arsenosugar biosynthesis glycosyltransferase [Streptomyces sp. H10-C2]|uniref:TIGR04282 family arsenosugar biosynthesis glycosyltransferase n=1 Tax=unclassified Streptomyces TaxID=2593676 RepID=UPI0024BB3220|nr:MULTISPECIES: TIGR04282 family arsenosugar biosynthesis glycosyltransferase [unclassified Streptomyces]MDJ0346586.1 TIGR04282 family arsenosugar biosynthesis glycosyltransferase [Streptomyces sp. PH10-H1]MDJ0375041.1 TIGR04282 family arsenosugar biosynthesis glycosyltransferase [Streptomyces sp. H10-C2]
MSTPEAAVLVMAKAPRPGEVKTRLHPLLGPTGCAALQAALITHTVDLTTHHDLRTYLAFDPPDARDGLRALVPAEVRLLPQRGHHLGQRLAAAVDDVFAKHAGPLLVVGTDAPTLTGDLLTAALGALASGSDAVLGLALDGGYYLIGMNRPHTRLFALDPDLWSGNHVLAATLDLAHRQRLRTHLLPVLRDLDTPQDAAALLTDPLLPTSVADLLRSPQAASTPSGA